MSERTWITEPEEYVSTLSPSTLEIAEEELREDPNTRKQALTSLREWIKQNQKIVNCRLGKKKKINKIQSREN